MGEVEHSYEVACLEDVGNDVIEDNLPMHIVQLWHNDVDNKCEDEEDASNDTTAGVDFSDDLILVDTITVSIIPASHSNGRVDIFLEFLAYN